MRVNQWGRRRLAYPIQHHREGFYVFVDMVLTPETVSELDRTLKVSEEVIRHLIKLRDPKTVQKEREARANAATQAVAAPEGEASAEAPTDGTTEESAEPQQEALAGEETDSQIILTADEDSYVPPAIEEETIEA
jgi:small subunit ribosomal protein S6